MVSTRETTTELLQVKKSPKCLQKTLTNNPNRSQRSCSQPPPADGQKRGRLADQLRQSWCSESHQTEGIQVCCFAPVLFITLEMLI